MPANHISRVFALTCISAATMAMPPAFVFAQAPASVHQLGTVKTVAANVITIATAAGAEVSVTVPPDARVLQLPPGTTDLKAGAPAKIEDVAVGDRMLAIGAAGDSASSITATRVILMKSGDIAARNAAEQADWQKRGTGGLVKAVDGPQVTVSSGPRTVKIETTPKTIFKRYADDSVAFADAKPSTLTYLHPGDQLRARGAMSDDHTSLTADEIVSGTFANFSGVISAINASANTLTLKDLATKKSVTVEVTPKADMRKLSPEAAARFTARNTPAAAAGGGAPPAAAAPSGAPAGSAAPRRAGADLSQMLSHLPTQTLADLKAGDTVMIVATEENSQNPTAITLLSGVESILAATPSGSRPITLSPWNTGEPEGGGGAQQ